MNKKRQTRVPFGILNIGGLVETKPIMNVDDVIGAEVVTPLFCHESFKIKPTFGRHLDKKFALMEDGFHYQKKFRRMVLWDFGDGYTEEGYSVEHSYTKPGYYDISCTFYDINRRAWKNTYKISVVVKEPIPTELRFEQQYTKTEINCSKIERVVRLEALLSSNCSSDLQIKANRIFSQKEDDDRYEEIGRNYKEIPDEILKFSRKSWTFLENTQSFTYTNTIYKENLKPTELFTPSYTQLYGRYIYDESNKEEPIKLELYHVIPFKEVDEKIKTIRVLNPNCKIDDLLSHEGDYDDYLAKFTTVISIIQRYTVEQLPNDVTPIGKRAWVDIFYKNDYVTTEGHENVFTFQYDIEHKNITRELLSSDNYLTMNPLGCKVNIVNNDIQRVKCGVSLDCFLRHLEEDGNYTIDEYLINGLVSGVDIDFYLFPYIEYSGDGEVIEDVTILEEQETDFMADKNMYYIPKDCKITTISPERYDTNSEFNAGDSEAAEDGIEPWLSRLRFTLCDDFNYNILFGIQINDTTKNIEIPISISSLIKPEEIEIPTETLVNENIKELVDVYTNHPMFDETPNVREFFNIVLSGQNMLNYTLTRSKNFLNDFANVKTCYLSSLISMLKMMGQDVVEFEKSSFDGVNDLRDFVRILSINHSELVGHVINKKPDIVVRNDRKGSNVGDEIKPSDILTIKNGKILTLERNGKTYDYKKWDATGVELIIQDKYTFDTKIVNLGLVKDGTIQLRDYNKNWGWNLLLPAEFEVCQTKLKNNELYKETNNGRDLYSKSELNRVKNVKEQLISGYYAFFVLYPNVNKKRVGNYLSNNSITEDIENLDKWNEKWGITHKILMKILRDNGNYKNGKEVVSESIDGGSTYNTRRIIESDGMWGEIDTSLYIDGSVYEETILNDDIDVHGKLQIVGMIYGKGEQYLEIRLDNASVGGKPIKTEEDFLQFLVKVNDDNEIKPTKQIYHLVADGYEGQLSVKLCGKLKKDGNKLIGLLWDASIDLFSK